ncbi:MULTISPECIES: DUF5623 domain-containing protein [Bradyrhizobium]|uniref:DUF5623 domain-containing protein n=1 Tax=Bradyrhizobium TaxID=374 RepID=UPI000ADC9BA7|nr:MULTISPECIES: DUF5623 domain-containing protein [Bradyrhizobium]
MSHDHIRPSSIEGIKQLANRLKKANGLKHSVALDMASKAAGCENFTHARRSLGTNAKPRQAACEIYISVPWRDRATKATGREILKMMVSKPLDALVSPAQYKIARGLIAMRREGPDHIADTYTASSKLAAQEAACAAARTLQFIDATNLKPSKAKRSLPRGDFQNRMPGSDHDSAWFDPATKIYIRANEPYSQGDVTAEQLKWATQHGWTVAAAPWKGMYNPDGGSWLFLAADTSKGYSLDPIILKLAAAPAPIVVADWSGESRPFLPEFVSPGRLAETKAKAAMPKSERPRGTNNSVEYALFPSGPSRRPKAQMPVEGHKAVGRLLKSVLVDTRQRAGVYRRVDAIRCELDNWVQCEYKRDELSDEVFFNLYYQGLPKDDPLAVPPAGRERHIASLAEVVATLAQYYPECPPLRALLTKANQAIASLRAWR